MPGRGTWAPGPLQNRKPPGYSHGRCADHNREQSRRPSTREFPSRSQQILRNTATSRTGPHAHAPTAHIASRKFRQVPTESASGMHRTLNRHAVPRISQFRPSPAAKETATLIANICTWPCQIVGAIRLAAEVAGFASFSHRLLGQAASVGGTFGEECSPDFAAQRSLSSALTGIGNFVHHGADFVHEIFRALCDIRQKARGSFAFFR